MNWQPIDNYSTLTIGEVVIITDGTDWERAVVIGDNSFAEKEGDMMVWCKGITHFAKVVLPG